MADTRERMLETASRELRRHGYEASSLKDILEASDAPRGSLYHHFPGGKDQLVYEATRRSVERITRALEETMAATKDPVAGVRAYVEAAAAELRRSDYAFGCPVAPVVLDDPPPDSSLAELCRATFDAWKETYAAHLTEAGVDPARVDSLAIMLVAAVEGGLLLARAHRDTGPLDAVADELAASMEAALP